MRANLLKIEKIATGISQLFTAMDKGFAKVESDLTLLTRFRHICFDANDKLEEALQALKRFEPVAGAESMDKEQAAQIHYELSIELIKIRDIVSNNILMITDYINEFSELWEKTFSLVALQKFRLLLMNEFNILNKEIELLAMQELIEKRQEVLNRATTALKAGNEK